MPARTVRMTIRPAPVMRARIRRFTEELALPTEGAFVLYCVASEIDRLRAQRGEVSTAALRDRELRAHLGRAASHPRVELAGEARPPEPKRRRPRPR